MSWEKEATEFFDAIMETAKATPHPGAFKAWLAVHFVEWLYGNEVSRQKLMEEARFF